MEKTVFDLSELLSVVGDCRLTSEDFSTLQ